MRLGRIIRRYRAFEEISLRDLAKQTGVSLPTLSRIERGKMPDAPTLVRLLLWLFSEEA